MSRFDLGPKPLLGYTNSLIDRAAEQRNDDAFLAALRDETGTPAPTRSAANWWP